MRHFFIFYVWSTTPLFPCVCSPTVVNVTRHCYNIPFTWWLCPCVLLFLTVPSFWRLLLHFIASLPIPLFLNETNKKSMDFPTSSSLLCLNLSLSCFHLLFPFSVQVTMFFRLHWMKTHHQHGLSPSVTTVCFIYDALWWPKYTQRT